jgi:hypothetical protein
MGWMTLTEEAAGELQVTGPVEWSSCHGSAGWLHSCGSEHVVRSGLRRLKLATQLRIPSGVPCGEASGCDQPGLPRVVCT